MKNKAIKTIVILGIIVVIVNLLFFTIFANNITEKKNNIAPIVSAGENINVDVGERFNFAGSAYDEDGEIVSYEWDANGDGKYDTFCKNCAKDSYVFEDEGIYIATLKVKDNKGAVTTDQIIIIVE